MQIKVEHTKQHRISKLDDIYPDVMVAEGKLVLVKNIGGILAQEGNGKFNIVPGAPNIPSIEQFNISKAILPITYYKPIIISETEVTKGEECWYYNHVFRTIVFGISHGYSKILALPEHFSPEQLQMVVDGKLKDGDKVLVECDPQPNGFKGTRSGSNGGVTRQDIRWINYIKLNSSNHITLHKVEEKMYTREEVIDILDDYRMQYPIEIRLTASDTRRWFEQKRKIN
jgi:hypothetical protein